MNCKLYGREQSSTPLHLDSRHTSYRTAVQTGQQRFGHGNFMIVLNDPNGVPSREDQLLIHEVEYTRNARRRILNSI